MGPMHECQITRSAHVTLGKRDVRCYRWISNFFVTKIEFIVITLKFCDQQDFRLNSYLSDEGRRLGIEVSRAAVFRIINDIFSIHRWFHRLRKDYTVQLTFYITVMQENTRICNLFSTDGIVDDFKKLSDILISKRRLHWLTKDYRTEYFCALQAYTELNIVILSQPVESSANWKMPLIVAVA